MKFHPDWKVILPYVLIPIIGMAFLLFFIPFNVQKAYQVAAETGLPPNFTGVYLAIGIVGLLIVATFIFSRLRYAQRNTDALKQLTRATAS